MKKQKFALALLSTLIVTASYASYQQNVQVCLNVSGNTSDYPFRAHFESSDVFDSGTRVKPIVNGESCASHTYRKGPKNIRIDVGVLSDFHGHNIDDILITLDSSCSFMQNEQSGFVKSDYQRTSHPNESWTLNLMQAEPINGYKFAYNLTCQHSSN